MNMIKYLKQGRARLAMIIVVQQCNAINERATATRVARAFDCSVPTARKYLENLVNDGLLAKEKFQHREDVTGYQYRTVASFEDIPNGLRISINKAMVAYWSECNV